MRSLLPALAFAAALTLVLASGASARPLDIKPVVFNDPTGDSGAAADVASVTVSNDPQGDVSFDIAFTATLAPTTDVDLYLDTDLNSATGDPQDDGADVVIEDREHDQTYGFYKWDGTKWGFVSAVGTHVSTGSSGKDLIISSGSADLGQLKGVNFFVESFVSDGSSDAYDDAPAAPAVWQYMLQVPVTLTVYKAVTQPVKAGGVWVFALSALRSDTNELLGGEGTVTCTGSSGSTKLVAVTHAFVSAGGNKGSAAVCGFKVSKKLKHKLLHGTITVSYAGSTVTHTFTQKAG
jgi:hypothetical protein